MIPKIGEIYWDNYHKCLIKIIEKHTFRNSEYYFVYDDITPDYEGNMVDGIDLHPEEFSDIFPVSNLTRLLYLGEQCNP